VAKELAFHMENPSIDLSSPLLDSDQVQMLISSGGDDAGDLIEEILELFEEESTETIASMEASINAGNSAQLAKSAHALAGSSANIGATQLWQSAKNLENSAKEGCCPPAEVIDELKSLYGETIKVFNRIRSDLQK
jgi:HPt (histidine-containing phosphotransfer) domain-containing protein